VENVKNNRYGKKKRISEKTNRKKIIRKRLKEKRV
jgi:hypothetical protein